MRNMIEKRKIFGQPDTTRRREPDWKTSKEKPVKIDLQRPGNSRVGDT